MFCNSQDSGSDLTPRKVTLMRSVLGVVHRAGLRLQPHTKKAKLKEKEGEGGTCAQKVLVG